MSDTGIRTLAVGALASATGLTVRTLHHWDAIGLLVPSDRTAAGHRRYTDADVQRLYRIVALRDLGLGLDAIGGVLDRGGDVRGAVQEHLAALERRIEAEEALRRRLAGLLEAFDALGEPSTAEFLQTIEVMTMFERYYTPEQLQALERRRDDLGEAGMQQAQQDWATLYADVETEKARGTDPADPAMQALAARHQELIDRFTGGDAGIESSLRRMYREQGTRTASRGMVDPELNDYLQRAVAVRRG